MNEIITKKCTKCGETLAIDCFSKKKIGFASQCKRCISENGNKWNKEHRERVRENYKKWISENPRKKDATKNAAYQRKYNQGHKEKKSEYNRRYKEKHPENTAMHNNNKRALSGKITGKSWLDVIEKYGSVCLCCGNKDLPVTIDHVVPLSKGGINATENLQPLCKPCNSRKRDKVIDYRPL